MADSSNAYATVSPLKKDISDWVINQEELDFANREEQRKIDALNKSRQDKEQAKKDKLREKMMGQIPQNYDTGSSSLNEFQAKIIQQGVNRLGEIYKQLNNPSLSEDERIKLEIEAQNIDNLPDNLKVATDNFTKTIQDYKTKKANGEYFANPEFEKLVLNGFENYVGVLDNGLPAVGFIDRNEDGTINNLDALPYDQLQQGIGNWGFQKQFDLDGMALDAAKKIGYEDITTDNNFKSVQEKKAKISSVEAVATNLLQNPDGSPTDVALSQMKKMGIAPSDESLKQVKDYFMQRVLANTDYTKKENMDYSGQTGRMAENRQGKKEDEKPSIGNPVVPSKNTWGNQYERISATEAFSVPIVGKVQLPAISIKTGTKGGKPIYENVTDATLENYTYNKDGKLVIDVSYGIDKTTTVSERDEGKQTTVSKEKRKKQIIASPETEARIASQLGISVQQLKEAAGYSGKPKETASERIERLKKERGLK
jgi:hypothetical protein